MNTAVVEKTATSAPSADVVELPPLTTTEIMELIPHRYPFLMIDRITRHTQGRCIEGYKNITFNEPYFAGHFPSRPIMPGVLQIEALAQLGSVMIASMPQGKGKLAVFSGIDNVRFRRMVTPGETLVLKAELVKFRHPVGKSKCSAWVNEELVVEAELMFSLID